MRAGFVRNRSKVDLARRTACWARRTAAAVGGYARRRGWTSRWECSWVSRSRPRWPRAGGSCARRGCRTRRARRCRAPCTPRRRCSRTCAAGSARTARRPRRRTCACSPARARSRSPTPSELLAFDGAGADHHRPGDALAELAGEVRDDRVRVEPRLRLRAPRLPAALGDRGAARRPGPAHRRARRALRPPRPPAARGDARGRRGRRARLRDGRAVGGRGAGRAAGARRAAGAAGADLAALHLQRARRRRLVHPLAPGGGARAADRVRGVHPLRVRPPARRT